MGAIRTGSASEYLVNPVLQLGRQTFASKIVPVLWLRQRVYLEHPLGVRHPPPIQANVGSSTDMIVI